MNFLYGSAIYGRSIYGGYLLGDNGGNDPNVVHEYYPNQYIVIAYAADGTITAMFGSGMEENALSELSFSITATGCGDCTMKFKRLPKNADLFYMQRISVHLFGDPQPWYSGYILSRPVEGTTEDTYTFKAHGYYNRLSELYVFKIYENMDVGDIVRDIAKEIEKSAGLIYSGAKIINSGYVAKRIVFDGVSVKDALKTLSDFAIDYVYGVDEYRNLYFRPRNNKINEQARLTVGMHVGSYIPEWDASKVVNWARIKGGGLNTDGEQWLCIVEDTESQQKYGMRQAVWNLPEVQDAQDAQRWGLSQLAKYKEPTRSAKVKDVVLEYPLPDGTFNARHMSTEGEAEIRALNGEVYRYPITKISYSVTPENGITADMQLGEPVFLLDRYLLEQERKYKASEQASASALKQLSGTVSKITTGGTK